MRHDVSDVRATFFCVASLNHRSPFKESMKSVSKFATLSILAVTLASCAPAMNASSGVYAQGDTPVPPGEIRTFEDGSITLDARSTLAPGLYYPGNAYAITGVRSADALLDNVFPTTSRFSCGAREHRMWMRANGRGLEADTTARLKALGYTVVDAVREKDQIRLLAGKDGNHLMFAWVMDDRFVGLNICRVATR